MTNQHPITVPSELIEQWYETADDLSKDVIQEVATQAARWGADQELEACVEWMGDSPVIWRGDPEEHPGFYLREARRPKPLSLKQQALATLEEEPDDSKELFVFDTAQVNIIRAALKQLSDD